MKNKLTHLPAPTAGIPSPAVARMPVHNAHGNHTPNGNPIPAAFGSPAHNGSVNGAAGAHAAEVAAILSRLHK